MKKQQPALSFWQVWNVSFGFLGVQFGFALQNANASRILQDLGADPHALSFFWLVAPLMGLIVQPFVGAASDRTWNRIGRRRPFILAGSIVAALGMCLMPNASLFVAFILPIVFGVCMLALMDAAFNVCFQPFRALVSDMVPAKQRNVGYSVQTLLINIGAVVGSILPFLLTNIIGLSNISSPGQVAETVIWSFYLGATVLLGAVLWTVFRTKEYPPEEYYAYKGMDAVEVERQRVEKKSVSERFNAFIGLVIDMPLVMKRLAVVQFFSWFALFIMWVYTNNAIAQHIWGVDPKWFSPAYAASVGGLPADIAAARGAAGDWVGILFAGYSLFAAVFAVFLTKLANTFGRKVVFCASLLVGGVSYISFLFIQNLTMVDVNLLITQVTVPMGAVYLLVPMIGVGIAWAAILAMPYAMLAGALPADKTGIYMGIFNFTIAMPQIISALTAGLILKYVFDSSPIQMIVLAGVFMLCAAVSVLFVNEDTNEA
ncbi:MAG: MFS transporter [Pseudomonadota bacterium]